MRVFVYWNFNKKLWSIKSMETGRVIDRRANVCLSDCTLKVSEAGRQRVLREKRKNVHAGVVGYISDAVPSEALAPIAYNPYKYASFVNRNTQEPIHNAAMVCMQPDGRCMAT